MGWPSFASASQSAADFPSCARCPAASITAWLVSRDVAGIPASAAWFEAARVDRARQGSGLPLQIPTVELLEMKDVEIPQDMQRVMAMEAEAMREKRARIIKAEAELEASQKLADAAKLMVGNPAALELRRRNVQSGGIPFRVPGAGVVPILACVVIIGMLTSITLDEWTSIVITAAAAAGLYVLSYRHRAKIAKARAAA